MESTWSENFLSASLNETECYLHHKRIKIESNQKNIEKEEQQKPEQTIHGVNRYQTPLHEPVNLSERQNNWSLEKQSCDTTRNTCMRELLCFNTYHSDRLPCRLSENKLSTKKWIPESENQLTMEDDISLNTRGWPLETELHNVWNASDLCKPQAKQNNSIEQNNKRNCDSELRQNSSAKPLNRDLIQTELLNHKSVSDKKWQQYQLLQLPFLCCTSSVFSHTEHEKNNFLKKVCRTEDKDYSSTDNKTAAERDETEKNNSSYKIPTLKPFRRMQPLEIPSFQFPSISNKINSKMPSSNLKEVDLKNFKGMQRFMESEEIYGAQKIPEIGKQKKKNDKSIVKASTVGSEFKEKNYQATSKQEYSPLAKGEVSLNYFRGNTTDMECNQIFAKNHSKDQILENSDNDDDQKSRIHIYISVKNIQNEKCTSYNDPLKRMGKKSSNENVGTFHLQSNFPIITEALEKNKLLVHCGVGNPNSDISLYEAESKLSTKEILDFNSYLTKNTFECNSVHIGVQNFPDTKGIFNTFREKKILRLKFSFQNMLFERFRMWTESLGKDMSMSQDGSVTQWFPFCETLNEKCDTQHLAKSSMNRSYTNIICIILLAITSKHVEVKLVKKILASFFHIRNTLLPVEGKSVQVEKDLLCGRKQLQMNSCTDKTLKQTTKFHKNKETYPGFITSEFVESIGFGLHKKCQRRCFSRSLGEAGSSLLKQGTLFQIYKSRLCKGRHFRKHHFLSRGSEVFSNYLRLVSHKSGMKKKYLVGKCLILLQGTFCCSLLQKMYCCNITKIQYLIGANLRVWNYFPAHSQLKFEKINSKCTNLEILATTVKEEKKKPTKMLNSSFNGEIFKAFPVALCENRERRTTAVQNCMKTTNEVTNEVTDTMKKYLGTSSYVNADRKELQINFYSFCSKPSCSIFDTFEKISLHTDSEDFDQIPIANQNNPIIKKLSEDNAATSPKEVNNSSGKCSQVLILPEQSKPSKEKNNSFLMQESQVNTREDCKRIDTYHPLLANKKEKVEGQNPYLNFENVLPNSSNVYQPVTLPLDSCSFGIKDGIASDSEHCRNSSSADKQKQSDKIPATTLSLSIGPSAMTETNLQLEAKETEKFSLPGHPQTAKAVSFQPAALKQHLEYVKEEEEISDKQMHVTNESQCETLMNDLIMSHSEDESKTFIATEEKLKVHLSAMNNGCLEDVEDKYVPLENKITYEFELKRKFDLVLEELHMFHEISKGNENNLSSLETNSHNNSCELNNSKRINENVTSVSQKKICVSYPICDSIEEQNIVVSNENSLNEKISNENEDQEVPKEYCVSRLPTEELLHSPIAERCFLSHEVIRVQPLKTCKGPIRIGLSRKARPKQLHPYLK
ncbi:RAD51-associated protein 2 isoform X2 [Heliangelus exortis]|uniref:RAD51-associated protein 2 isoform X2 n=1 Tax=Heliangelus exortis TaxID=472823 RepID=UPI003A8E825C